MITVPRTRGFYCDNVDEVAMGCTAGEQLPWQQMSQLQLKKIKKSAVSGEIQQTPL